MQKTLSLRNRFALWISLVVIACGSGLMFSVYLVSSRLLKTQAGKEMNRIVDKTAEDLDIWIDNRARDAVNLSELESLAQACTTDKRADAQQALSRIQQRSPFYENVFLADANGKLFLDSIDGKSVGIDLMSSDDYRVNVEHSLRGEVWIGEVKKSPATGRAVVLITAPVRAGNRIVGMLGTPIELSNFSESFVSKVRLRDTGYLYLVDATGTILAHPDAKQILMNRHYDFVNEMLRRGSGSLEYEFEGIVKAAYFSRAQRKPWTVVAAIPAKEVFASARTIQLYLLLFGLITLAATVVAVAFLAARVSGMVQRATSEVESAVEQLLANSLQISSSSQSLAQSASEQAASIEETSSSAQEISSITRQNTDRSQKVAQLMDEAIPIVSAVNRSHQELAASLVEMAASSEKVAKVIKMIDEIAFQTNILALNAAVEAARAGEAGMGFAVVADEVRNLAQRSAGAARDTASLIAEALVKSRDSKTKLDTVLKAMEANNKISGAVKVETDEIRVASEEQARGIAQIGSAVAQMSNVTQVTAAQAEESAAASEELKAQAEALKEISHRLERMVRGGQPKVAVSLP